MARLVAERSDLLPVLAEVFREHGYDGASLSLITQATGLGKGSLYHFFPGGKQDMVNAVLAEIDGWFETHIFLPLETAPDPSHAIGVTLEAVETYFRSGRRVCLVGVLALNETRDLFAATINAYFARWVATLALALRRMGLVQPDAQALAEEVVADIQGAIVLARALDDPATFSRLMTRLRARIVRE